MKTCIDEVEDRREQERTLLNTGSAGHGNTEVRGQQFGNGLEIDKSKQTNQNRPNKLKDSVTDRSA